MEEEKQSYKRQYIVAFSATLIAATSGTVVGWTSPSLPRLLDEGFITPDDASWIASIYMLSSTVSVLPAAYMADHIGRKSTILLGSVPFIIGWILIYLASSANVIYVSRVLSGLGHGIAYTVCPLYLGEIASDSIRGALTSMITMMSKAGILFGYCLGPYTSIQMLALINLSWPLLFLVLFKFQPESPHFYVKKDRSDLAEKSLKQLLNNDEVSPQLAKIQILISDQMKQDRKWINLIKSSENRSSLAILLMIYTTQQFCGSSAVIAYAQQIFTDAGGNIEASASSIILGSVQFIMAFISVMAVDKLGRKPLLVISTFGVTLANIILCVYFYLHYLNTTLVANLGWLPIFTVCLFIISYSVGLATVPFAITSEVFPANIKSYASSVIQMYAGIANFAVVKLYQVIGDHYGQHVIFLCFTLVSLAGMVFVVFVVTETKNKSFSEISAQISESVVTLQ